MYHSLVEDNPPVDGRFKGEINVMKKILALLLALLMLLGVTACAEKEPETVRLRLATGTPDSTYYAFGGYIGKHATENAEYLEVLALEGVGSADSCRQLQQSTVELALCQSDVMVRAYEGTGEFSGEGAKVENFSVVGALYRETLQMMTLDPAVKTVADLKGRCVAVGTGDTAKEVNAAEILEACGVAAQDVTLVCKSVEESVEALKAGEVDAIFVMSELPSPALVELAKTRTTYALGLEEAAADQLARNDSLYTRAVIPAGTYYTQEKDLTTVETTVVLLVRNDVPEESVRALTADLFDRGAELAETYPLCGQLGVEFGASVTAVPYHAGAAAYFAEKGLTVPVAEEG